MAVTRGLGTTGDGAGTVTPLDHKLAQAGLIAKAGGNAIRPGLFYDGVSNIVTGRANMAYDVQPFTAALTRGAAAGAVLLSNDGVVTVSTTAAPGSNSRIDVVYVWQREFSLDGVNSNPVIGVLQGTPAASPVAPSLAAFPGAIELARITVPAGITATTSAVITQTAPFTTADGGPLVRRTVAEMNAIATPGLGLVCLVLATGVQYRFNGTRWVPEGAYCELSVSAGSIANNTTVTLGAAGAPAYTEGSDVLGWRDPATNPQRITPNVPGRYRVEVQAEWVSNGSGVRIIQIARNGAAVNRIRDIVQASSDSVGSAQLSTVFTMNGTSDFISVTVFQNSGAALAVTADVVVSYLGPAL